jgi:hypothetical protein
MSHHPQIKLLNPWLGDVHVDVGMAPLLAELWRLGIQTNHSCQNCLNGSGRKETGNAYLIFTTFADYQQFFMQLFRRCAPSSAVGRFLLGDTRVTAEVWVVNWYNPDYACSFTVTQYIPVRLLPEMLAALQLPDDQVPTWSYVDEKDANGTETLSTSSA